MPRYIRYPRSYSTSRVSNVVTNPYTGEVKRVYGHSYEELNQNIEKQFARWETQRIRQENKLEVEQLAAKTEQLNLSLSKKLNILQSINKGKKYTQICYHTYYDGFLMHDDFQKYRPSNPPSLDRILNELNVPKVSRFMEFFSKKKLKFRLGKEAEAQQCFTERTKQYKEDEVRRKEKHIAEYQAFLSNLENHNEKIKKRESEFVSQQSGEVETVVDYFITQIVPIKIETKITFFDDVKQLLISIYLPPFESVPNVKEYKFIKTKKEIKTVMFNERQQNLLYENIILQIVLKISHDLFALLPFLESIIINGSTKTVDMSNGNEVNSCIISLETQKDSFKNINLALVDCKECIKGLKTHYKGKLQPVIPLNESKIGKRVNLKEPAPSSSPKLSALSDVIRQIKADFEQQEINADEAIQTVYWKDDYKEFVVFMQSSNKLMMADILELDIKQLKDAGFTTQSISKVVDVVIDWAEKCLNQGVEETNEDDGDTASDIASMFFR
ncbi:MAG: hypothetical protein BGN88_09445 [Clostridiales bacterium 43-6]|nr:MAG: hypothetical protein BGN88_09445 [Clostridiales bacterium 43-6]